MSEHEPPKDERVNSSSEVKDSISKDEENEEGEKAAESVDSQSINSNTSDTSAVDKPMDEKLESLAAALVDLPSKPTSGLPLKPLHLFLVSIAIIIFFGFVVVGYFGLQLLQKVDQIDQFDTQISSLSQQVNQQLSQNQASIEQTKKDILAQSNSAQTQLKQEIQAKVASELSDVNERFRILSSQSQTQVDMLQKRVDGHQQRLLSLSTTSREDWMLAEAEYLLKLANQRILLEKTSENVVALLESADQLLEQVATGTGDAELFAIRKALSRDLTVLKLVESPDRDGIYLKLQALAELIEQLPRELGPRLLTPFDPLGGKSGATNETSGDAEPKSSMFTQIWKHLKSTLGSLDNYIKWQDGKERAQPLLDQQFTQVASLNVRLLLQQAQIALLKQSPVVYSNSLNQAQELIAQYFVASQPSAEFQQSINELAAIDIAPQLPDISQSLKLLHGYIRQLHKIGDAAGGQL